MALKCQCDYVDELDDDIENLLEIQDLINKLIADDEDIHQILQSMGNTLPEVLIEENGADGLLKRLNSNSNLAIYRMNNKVSKTLADLREKRKEAHREDFFFHLLFGH